jgi:hypothetical protein
VAKLEPITVELKLTGDVVKAIEDIVDAKIAEREARTEDLVREMLGQQDQAMVQQLRNHWRPLQAFLQTLP